MQVLPSFESVEFNTLMFWSESELTELQASHVRQRIGREKADKDFRRFVIPFIRDNEAIFRMNDSNRMSDEEIMRLSHVVATTISAYAFDLEKEEEDESSEDEEGEDGWVEDIPQPHIMGMVPFADLLNSDAEFNAHLAHLSDRLEMTSLRDIKAGEEILNYYGPNPNGDLLRRYGYTSPKHSRYDVVEFEWGNVKDICSIRLGELGFDDEVDFIVKSYGLFDDEEVFTLERDFEGPDDTGLFRAEAKFTRCPDPLANILQEAVHSTMSRPIEDERKVKEMILRLFRDLLAVRIAEYPTTKAEDEQLLPQSSGRLRMAIQVRLGEKALLYEAFKWTLEKLKKYEPPVVPAQANGHRTTGQSSNSNRQKRQRLR
ncbi:hypothetical protein BT93_L5690 [Corymbia citriodora subsp. variegata]|uniref:SET domain-containing protein n=1 Tax=Corymbia citriodora subsp. variegata TaxID=360336 RepID=A0A8T0CGY0_CORYI|nr:hypothetical protein BT93_L5690 [Corymbia citriodora subsp. variegata]